MLRIKPLREPRANKISTTVWYYSRRLGRQVWCESNLEWDVAIVIDSDPLVVEYCEQSIELEWSKGKWIPDFVVLLKDGDSYKILIIEVKYVKELLENYKWFKQKYDETRKYISMNKKKLISEITNERVNEIEFIVVTDKIINQSFRVQNLRKLMEASINPRHHVEIKPNVEAIMTRRPMIKLGELFQALSLKKIPKDLSDDDIWTVIYFMIYNFELMVDYDQLLTTNSMVFNNNTTEIDYESIDRWFKKYNWENEDMKDDNVIPFIDLYGIGSSLEKSIELWDIANERLRIIQPLFDKSVDEIKKMEFKINGDKKSWKSIYRWLLAYSKSGGDLRSLIPNYNKRGRKIPEGDIESELWEYGKEEYKKMEKKSVKRAFERMQSFALDKKQLDKCMSYCTFNRRIKKLNQKEVSIAREGRNKAEKMFDLSKSEFPHGDYALQSVQIDHTPIDVLVVDEEHRKVTERPFLTVAFDSYSRCVLGYYITYDKPSRLSIAMTLMNCIKEKGATLRKVRDVFPNEDPEKFKIIESSGWKDVYGFPFTLHLDNGSDFRSNDVRIFAKAYKLHLHYRAVKKAQHGAYVERYLGTLNNRLHEIKGTTQSNVQERGDYPSEKKAIYTIDELEARVITEIILYHEEVHSKIRTTPLAKWRESFSSNNVFRGLNRNLNRVKEARFKIDVLPSNERTVQKAGVEIFNLFYTHDEIEKFVGMKETNGSRKSRRFRIRFDPRDIRTIWFYDDINNKNIKLKCTDRYVNTLFKEKPISKWEWEAIRNDQIIKGKREENIERKLRLLSIHQDMDKEVAHRTKSARQKEAKRTKREKDRKKHFNETENDDEETFSENLLLDEFNNGDFIFEEPEGLEVINIPPDDLSPFSNLTEERAMELARKENRK
jgi:putative transposase